MGKVDYRKIARELGFRLRIGKYGVHLLPRDPSGRIYRFISIVPLDGWITDPEGVYKEMKKRNFEL